MAFGFFKKQETADLILSNAKVCTMDYSLPWASAVAIKEDKIIAVGDIEMMDELIDSSTEIRDLDGKYVFPGFINIYNSPCMKVFENRYADLTECKTTDEVIETLKEWDEDHPDEEVIFGFGYNESLKPSTNEEDEGDVNDEMDEDTNASKFFLDDVSDEKPIVLLCKNTVTCWTNSVAENIVRETAEEEFVQIITVNYVLNLFIPFDFEEVEMDVKSEIEGMSDRGFTSILNIQSPNYFENLYQDSIIGLYNEGEMRQRFFGTYFVNRPIIPETINYMLLNRKTTCMEMGDMVHANMLNLYIDNASSNRPFTDENLKLILEEVCERGFDIYINAVSGDDMILAYDALEYIREKNYKNQIVIASDYLPLEDEYLHKDECYSIWQPDIFKDNPFADQDLSIDRVLEMLTKEAAKVIGMEDKLGTIAQGKLADLAIFEENPYDYSPDKLSRLHAVMTILNGEIVYDLEAEADEEMYDLVSHMQM